MYKTNSEIENFRVRGENISLFTLFNFSPLSCYRPEISFQETLSNNSGSQAVFYIHCMIHTIEYYHRKYRCLVYHWRQQLPRNENYGSLGDLKIWI